MTPLRKLAIVVLCALAPAYGQIVNPGGGSGGGGGTGGTVETKSAPYVVVAGDCGNVISTTAQVTLASSPPSSTCPVGIQNSSASPIAVLPNGVTLYDANPAAGSTATRYLLPGQSMLVWTNGTSYFAWYSTNGSTYIFVTNAASTGTTVDTWTKLTGAPSTAVIAATTDTAGMVGVCVAGCGTTGLAVIQTSGITPLLFAGATTAGDYGTISSGTAGNGADSATIPTSGPLARIQSTNGSAGTYNVDLIFADGLGGAGGSGCTASGSAGVVQASNGSGGCQTTSATDNGTTFNVTDSSGVTAKIFGLAGDNDYLQWEFNSNDALLYTGAAQNMYWTVGTATVPNNGAYKFSSTANATGTPDTGLSRDAAGVIDFGTGAQGSTAGSWKGAAGTLSAGVNLSGTGSPLEFAGSAGTSGNCAISGGASTTPNWGSCGNLAFPATVSGTTTSGGIPYFSSTTALTSSAALALQHILLGGGAGGAPTSDSALDDGATTANTLTYTGSGGITASAGPITSASDGTHSALVSLVGNTTVPASLPSNSSGWLGPNSASFTSYFFQPSATAPSGTALMEVAATSSNVTQVTYATLASLAPTVNGTACTLAASCYTPVLQNSQSGAYTTVLADEGKQILHPTSDNNARTFTIDSNANVAYPIGATLTFVNLVNTVTIAITSDTLTWGANTGSRTLAAGSTATALKVGTTQWIINGGPGLT